MTSVENIPMSISAARKGSRVTVRIVGHIGWETDAEEFRLKIDELIDGGATSAHLYINTPGGS